MKKREGPKAPPTPDYQEEEALQRALTVARQHHAGVGKSAIEAAISEWVKARAEMVARPRLSHVLAFDIGDAKVRGFIMAALPQIAATLSHLPPDVPFFALPKEQVVDVFAAGIAGTQEAAVAANESLGFPFSDEIPF